MSRRINLNLLYQAAYSDFLGVPKSKIAEDLDVSAGPLTNWAKHPEWIDYKDGDNMKCFILQ